MVESNSDEILRDAQTEDVAFLVVGDPFGYEKFKIHNLKTNMPYFLKLN